MHDEAHVLLVDAHAEGCRCYNDVVTRGIGDPFLLARHAFRGGESCVVRGGADAFTAETRSQGITVGAEGDVDDA